MHKPSIVRTTQHSIQVHGIGVASGLIFRCIVAGWLAFAPSLIVAAEAKKKGNPNVALKSDVDHVDTAKTRASEKPKTKVVNPTSAPKPEKPAAKSVSAPRAKLGTATNVAIAPEELVEFHAQSAAVKKLIESSLDLARQNLTYSYGSSDPANGGLDCSGFIYSSCDSTASSRCLEIRAVSTPRCGAPEGFEPLSAASRTPSNLMNCCLAIFSFGLVLTPQRRIHPFRT